MRKVGHGRDQSIPSKVAVNSCEPTSAKAMHTSNPWSQWTLTLLMRLRAIANYEFDN